MLINLTIASLMILVTTILHVIGLSMLLTQLKAQTVHLRQRHTIVRAYKIGKVVLVMFFLSISEICLWAGLYMFIGAIEEVEAALYFSTVSFTTLGYGDILLDEKWRLIGAFEAANGIILFGLTTAVIVAAVQGIYFSDESAEK